MNNIAKSVTKFVGEITGQKTIDPTEELIRSGMIDSFGILQLIMLLEAELGIKLEDDDLDAENFSTINSIIELIHNKNSNHACPK